MFPKKIIIPSIAAKKYLSVTIAKAASSSDVTFSLFETFNLELARKYSDLTFLRRLYKVINNQIIDIEINFSDNSLNVNTKTPVIGMIYTHNF